MFYRFMNDGNIKWRKLLYAVIDANPKFHKLYQMYKSVAR